jgi:RimJ/RimL family protein N-acetyltransferase
VKLDVAAYNARAIAFYKRAGFALSGDAADCGIASLPSGAAIPLIVMIRRPSADE